MSRIAWKGRFPGGFSISGYLVRYLANMVLLLTKVSSFQWFSVAIYGGPFPLLLLREISVPFPVLFGLPPTHCLTSLFSYREIILTREVSLIVSDRTRLCPPLASGPLFLHVYTSVCGDEPSLQGSVIFLWFKTPSSRSFPTFPSSPDYIDMGLPGPKDKSSASFLLVNSGLFDLRFS